MKLRIALITLIAMTTIAAPASATAHHKRHIGPLVSILRQYGPIVRCIMMRESHSTPEHLNLRDNNRYGSSGIFQFEDSTFMAHSPWHIHVWMASPYQQEVTFVRTVRVDGFGQWTRFDGC